MLASLTPRLSPAVPRLHMGQVSVTILGVAGSGLSDNQHSHHRFAIDCHLMHRRAGLSGVRRVGARQPNGHPASSPSLFHKVIVAGAPISRRSLAGCAIEPGSMSGEHVGRTIAQASLSGPIRATDKANKNSKTSNL